MSSDYPRHGRGLQIARAKYWSLRGTTPARAGLYLPGSWGGQCDRTAPAWAGLTRRRRMVKCWSRDYPRLGGADAHLPTPPLYNAGLPPPGRGADAFLTGHFTARGWCFRSPAARPGHYRTGADSVVDGTTGARQTANGRRTTDGGRTDGGRRADGRRAGGARREADGLAGARREACSGQRTAGGRRAAADGQWTAGSLYQAAAGTGLQHGGRGPQAGSAAGDRGAGRGR